MHEYAHFVLDYRLKKNYPRWFTEGVKQYLEYLYTGYKCIDKNNKFVAKKEIYMLRELEKNFDSLKNQALVYRESLIIVKFINDFYGEKSLDKLFLSLS